MSLSASRSALAALVAAALAGCPSEPSTPPDAGEQAGEDAAAALPDAAASDATSPGPDAQVPLDAAAQSAPDAGTVEDAGPPADASGPSPWDGGAGWDAGSCVPFDPAGKTWTTRAIDTIGGAPIYPHVRVGPDGAPVAVFTKAANASTRYAAVSRFESGAWSPPETVERVSGSSLGKRPSIAIGADGSLHVLAYDETGLRPRYSLKPPGGAWSTEALYDASSDAGDSSALAFDPSGRLHATFLKYGTYTIIHAVKEPSGWTYEAIQAAGASAPVKAGSASLAVDGAGRPHVAIMLSGSTNTLGYALLDQGGWTVETADATSGTGHYSNIALDLGGTPHVVSLRWPIAVADVRMASRLGGAWSVEPIEDGLGTTYTTGLSIVCDTRLVAFARNGGAGTGGLWFAWRRPSDSRWTLESVDSSVDVSGIDLAVGRDGRVHVAYLDETNFVLRHAMLQ